MFRLMVAVLVPLIAGCLGTAGIEQEDSRLPDSGEEHTDFTWSQDEFERADGAVAALIVPLKDNTTIRAQFSHTEPAARNQSVCRLLSWNGNTSAVWGRLFDDSAAVSVGNVEYHRYELSPVPFTTNFTWEPRMFDARQPILLVAAVGTSPGTAGTVGEASLSVHADKPFLIEQREARMVGCAEQPWDLQPEFLVKRSGMTAMKSGHVDAISSQGLLGWVLVSSDARLNYTFRGPEGVLGEADTLTGARFACNLDGQTPGRYELEVGEAAGDVEISVALVEFLGEHIEPSGGCPGGVVDDARVPPPRPGLSI